MSTLDARRPACVAAIPLVVFSLLFGSGRAQDVQVDSATIITVGSCNISIAVNIGSARITGCNDVKSPAFQRELLKWFGETEYGESLQRAKEVGRRLNALTGYARNLDNSLSASRSEIGEISEELREIRSMHLREAQQQRALAQQLLDDAKREFSDETIALGSAQIVLAAQVQENQEKISDVNIDLEAMRDRVVLLETDVGYLMDEFRLGRFDKTLLFIGARVGGMAGRSRLHPRYDFLVDVLSPRFPNATLTLEVSRLNWVETTEYATLSGLEPKSFSEDASRTSVGLGAMYSLSPFSGSFRTGAGVTVGMGEGAYWATFLRATWARQSLLASVEIRTDSLERATTNRLFNDLGDATITYSRKRQFMPSLSVLVSMRIR